MIYRSFLASIPMEGDHEMVRLKDDYGLQGEACMFERVAKFPFSCFGEKVKTHADYLILAVDQGFGWYRSSMSR